VVVSWPVHCLLSDAAPCVRVPWIIIARWTACNLIAFCPKSSLRPANEVAHVYGAKHPPEFSANGALPMKINFFYILSLSQLALSHDPRRAQLGYLRFCSICYTFFQEFKQHKMKTINLHHAGMFV
jgi:hypothetical protein